MPARPTSISVEPQMQRTIAVELFNYVWTLLEKQHRTERENDIMIDAAHASRLFWEEIGQPVNHARGEWQISRVYATVERAEPALHHATRCLEICEQHGIGDFDLAYAYEALARAHGLAGDTDLAARYAKDARGAAERIAERDDRDALLNDLETLPR
jgi:hypothetical protein